MSEKATMDRPTQRDQWGDHWYPTGFVLPWTSATGNNGDWLAEFTRSEDLHGEALTAAVVEVLVTCLGVGPLPVILPPPRPREHIPAHVQTLPATSTANTARRTRPEQDSPTRKALRNALI